MVHPIDNAVLHPIVERGYTPDSTAPAARLGAGVPEVEADLDGPIWALPGGEGRF